MYLAGESTFPTQMAALVSTTAAAAGGTHWLGLIPQTVGGIASLIGIVGVLISVTIAILRYNKEQNALDEHRKQRKEKRREERIEAALRRRKLEKELTE